MTKHLTGENRDKLLQKLTRQLQADHAAALKSGNVSAAVTASKALADLLALHLEPAPPGSGDASTPITRIEHVIVRPGEPDRVIGDPAFRSHEDDRKPAPVDPIDDDLAERLLAILGDDVEGATDDAA